MKTLKYLFLLLLVAIIGGAIYISTLPSDFDVTRSRTINAPAEVIFDEVNDLKNWEAWNAWKEEDPSILITHGESTIGAGGHYTWTSDQGNGKMTTIAATSPESIEQEMQFEDLSPSKVSWSFEPTDKGTNVTWSIKGEQNFMLKAFSLVMGSMEDNIGPSYERGLEMLDSVVMNSMEAYEVKVNGISEYGGGYYLYRSTSATASNISQVMAQQYGGIMAFMQQHGIKQTGMPFTIYHSMQPNGNVIMSNAIPVRERIVITGDQDVLCGFQPATAAVKVTLKGNYTHLGEAWQQANTYLSENQLTQLSDIDPFEIYTTDPGDRPNPADWLTEVYIPIENKVSTNISQ